MKTFTNSLLLFLIVQTAVFSQNFRETLQTIDVQHYKLTLEVLDSTSSINATMDISFRLKKNVHTVQFDFVQKDSLGVGMAVDSISENNKIISYLHENNQLKISADSLKIDSLYTFSINYHGIPTDGLIISNNKFGDKTIFGDNWPNRAHHWFPCIDHPSDKATVEYIVTAPNTYQVIANGIKVEETNLSDSKKLYHYKTFIPLPTKVMVIGVAKFAVQQSATFNQIPVTTWVYPQTKQEGFFDFENATSILQFFTDKIGPYPFEKLANVQSKTRYGGMENASAIFYNENYVTGKRTFDATIAHEIAHQWFGNSVSEIDWPHIWLSEGFATYFENLYMLHSKGNVEFQKRIKADKNKIIAFSKNQLTPVLDFKTTNLMALLNPNSYEKGGFILYMLHQKVGEENFWNGIKLYYDTFKYKNAFTNDFKNTMSAVSGMNLDQFFKQWLEQAGHPILKTSWIYYQNKLGIIIDQTQETIFKFPLDVELIYEDGTSEIKTIEVLNKYEPHEIPTTNNVVKVNFDPNNRLLVEFVIE